MKTPLHIAKTLSFTLIFASLLTSCANDMASKAVHYVRKTYNDVDRIIGVSVDTVTLGDNLDYRIESADRFVEFAQGQVKYAQENVDKYELNYKRSVEWETEMRSKFGANYSSSATDSSLLAQSREELEKEKQNLEKELAWRKTLDSLKTASAAIFNEITAYDCLVVYNERFNCVYVQLDKDGNLLKITKDSDKKYLNPGEDVPGYLEALEKRYGKKLTE